MLKEYGTSRAVKVADFAQSRVTPAVCFVYRMKWRRTKQVLRNIVPKVYEKYGLGDYVTFSPMINHGRKSKANLKKERGES